MKKAVFLIIAVISLSSADAQLRKTPAEVTNSFQQKYPDAKDVSWQDRLTGGFEASFTLNDQKQYVSFNKKGEVQRTETVIDSTLLPTAVLEGWQKSKYTGWEIKEVRKIEPAGKAPVYKIEAKKNTLVRKNIYFNESGVLQRDNFTI